MDNLEEIDKFLQRYHLPRLNQEKKKKKKKDNLNIPIIITETA